MPDINDFKGDQCGFELSSGWSGYMYVTDQTGKRMVCPHPCEFTTVWQGIGDGAKYQVKKGRTGPL